jgi:cholestenol delta-isomerase
MDAEGGHPYFPRDVVVPGYAPNITPLPVILCAFGGILTVFVNVFVAVARWNSPALKKTEQLVIGWFLLCGLPCSSPRASTMRVADNLFRRIPPSLFRGYANQPNASMNLLTIRLGYFVLNHASIPSSQSLFAQLWKEYALSDSRYMTSDPFMLCIETLTVVFTPC